MVLACGLRHFPAAFAKQCSGHIPEERLLPLTNWTPAADQDFGKKGWRGAGETRQALAEWYQAQAGEHLHSAQVPQ